MACHNWFGIPIDCHNYGSPLMLVTGSDYHHYIVVDSKVAPVFSASDFTEKYISMPNRDAA